MADPSVPPAEKCENCGNLVARETRMRGEGRGRTSNLYRLNLTNVPNWQVGPLTNVPNRDDQSATGGTASKEDGTQREPKGGRRKRRTAIPEPFVLTDEELAWAAENAPELDVVAVTEEFVTYWRGDGGLKANWPETWKNDLIKKRNWKRSA